MGRAGSPMLEMRFLSGFLALAMLMSQSGCARPMAPTLPSPPSEETRSQFGRIGVTWVPAESPPTLCVPAAGSCAGSGRGALMGTLFGLSLVLQLSAQMSHGGNHGMEVIVFGGIVMLAIGIIPLAILIGSAYGAAAAHPPEEVDAAILSVTRAASDSAVVRDTARRILEAGGIRTDENLTWLEPGSGAIGDRVDSLLEVGPLGVALVGPYQINPSLRLLAELPVRLTRASDGASLYSGTFRWQSADAGELFEWAQDDGARIRRLLSGEGLRVADRFIDRAFLLHLLPTDREWKGRP